MHERAHDPVARAVIVFEKEIAIITTDGGRLLKHFGGSFGNSFGGSVRVLLACTIQVIDSGCEYMFIVIN